MMWQILTGKYRFQAVCVGLLAACLLSAWAGWAIAKSVCRASELTLKSQYAAEKLAAEKQHNEALQQALAKQQQWQQFVVRQGAQLAQINSKLDKQSDVLSKEIAHAIEQDKQNGGDCVGGIGANSLQIYNRAFGYAD